MHIRWVNVTKLIISYEFGKSGEIFPFIGQLIVETVESEEGGGYDIQQKSQLESYQEHCGS